MFARNDPRWAYVFVNLSTLLWSTNMLLGRLLRDDIGPFTLAALRFAVASIALALLVRHAPLAERRPGRSWPAVAAMGVAGVFVFSSLLYTGLRFTTASNAALINGIAPLVIGLLSALMLGEHFTLRRAIGACFSFAGVAMIVTGGSWNALTRLNFNVGDLLVIVAMVMWGLYSIFSRIATRTLSALSATFFSGLFGLPLLALAAAWEWQVRPPHLTPPVLLAILYIGLFPSLIAMLAWNEAVRRVGPARVTAFYNTLPAYGAMLGVLLLGEPFGLSQLIGGGLIVSGSLIAVWNDLSKG